jgi:hypothetical protein
MAASYCRGEVAHPCVVMLVKPEPGSIMDREGIWITAIADKETSNDDYHIIAIIARPGAAG